MDGFRILSQLRSHFPHTQSIMMETQTYESFKAFAVSIKVKNTESLPNLTETETTLYTYLAVERQRLEQARINQKYVDHCLQRLGSS